MNPLEDPNFWEWYWHEFFPVFMLICQIGLEWIWAILAAIRRRG